MKHNFWCIFIAPVLKTGMNQGFTPVAQWGWAKSDDDIQKEIQQIKADLEHIKQELNNEVGFIGWNILHNTNEALELSYEIQTSDVDGVIVFATAPFWAYLESLYTFNKPIIFFAKEHCKPFYGFNLMTYYVRWMLEEPFRKSCIRIVIDDYEWLKRELRAAVGVSALKNVRVLCIGGPAEWKGGKLWGYGSYETIRKLQQAIGMIVKFVSLDELERVFKQAPLTEEMREEYEELSKNAITIKDIKDEESALNAVKMYHVIKSLIQKYDCKALTINCYATDFIDRTGTTPCYAISRLNDEGIVSACEADFSALFAMLAATYTTKKAAFMGDPIFNEASPIIINAHCTAPTRIKGIDKTQEQYTVTSHYESGKGLAIEVLFKAGDPTTIVLVSNDLKTAIIAKGRITEVNLKLPICRNQIAFEIERFDEFFHACEENLHFYEHMINILGDHRKELESFFNYLGIRTIVI